MFVVLFDADIKNIIQLIKNTGETARHKINHIQNVLNTQYGLLNHTQVPSLQRTKIEPVDDIAHIFIIK